MPGTFYAAGWHESSRANPPEELEIMRSDVPAFKIKTGNLPVLLLHICTPDMVQLKKQLALRLSQTPDFFVSTPIVLELSALAELDAVPNFTELVSFMRKHGMCAAGVTGGSRQQRAAAAKAGLGQFPDAPVRNAARRNTDQLSQDANESVVTPAPLQSQPELPGMAGQQTVAGLVQAKTRESAPQPVMQAAIRPTMVIDKPVRTGQSVYAEGADLVLLAIANAGSELIADGDIHVYAPLRGKAIAGAHGNESARIFVHKLEAELLSIAGCYKVFEDGIPEEVRGKAAQIHLEGTRLVIEALPG